MTHNPQNDDGPTLGDPAPARDFGLLLLAAKLAGPLPLCGCCLLPCALCPDGCADHIDTADAA